MINDAPAPAAAAAAAPAPAEPARARAWCFTWNNPSTNILFPDGLPPEVVYIIYQREEAPTTRTPHLQGYICFKNPKSRSAVQKVKFNGADRSVVSPFAAAHLTVAKGSAEQNKEYCSKSASRVDGPWELGEMPANGQGKRNDLKEAVDKLLATSGDFSQIDPVTLARNSRGLHAMVTDLVKSPYRPNLKVICIVGKTGIGKSYAIQELYPDVLRVQWGNSGAWFPGYCGQKVIAFEEFRGQLPLQRMLQYLDFYPCNLEQKGGSFPAMYTLAFVTSNSMPSEWYKNDVAHPRDEELFALYRRLGFDPLTRVHDVRFIYAETRADLKRGLNLALSIDGLEPKSPKADTFFGKLPMVAPAAPAPLVVLPAPAADGAPQAPQAPRTPPMRSTSPEPARIRRCNAVGDIDMLDIDTQ